MPRKSFTSKARENGREPVDFDLDGVTLYAHPPKTAALLDLADVANAPAVEQVRAVMDFMYECLEPESREHVEGRLYDPSDNLEITDLTEVIRWLTEEFTARPTMPPRPSPPPSPRTGRRSTARSRSTASKRSTSPPSEVLTPSSP